MCLRNSTTAFHVGKLLLFAPISMFIALPYVLSCVLMAVISSVKVQFSFGKEAQLRAQFNEAGQCLME